MTIMLEIILLDNIYNLIKILGIDDTLLQFNFMKD